MAKLRNILFRFYSPFVDMSPEIFFNILKRKYPGIIINRLEVGLTQDLSSQSLPAVIQGFEDLSFLFWSTPVNRGVLRQDIDEASMLYRTISRMENPIGIEIGRFIGGSTILLAAAVGEMGKLVSIDINPPNDEALTKVLSQYRFLSRVQLVKGDANNVMLDNDSLYDFVFIDGDHSYEGARRDHNKWGAKVKINGYIIHHDMGFGRKYATQHSELSRLKTNILKTQADELELISEVGSMCFFQKKSANWILV